MFADISTHLISHWQDYFPTVQVPVQLHPLFIRGDKWNTIFVFSDKISRPHCVIEIAHGKNELLRRSADNTKILNRSEQLDPFCPRFFYFGCLGNDDMFIQEACDGIPLLFLLQQKLRGASSKKRYIRIAIDFLIKLHSLSISKYIFLDSNTLDEFFGFLSSKFKNNEFIRGIASSIKNKRLPLVLSHNDFIPSNILINKQGLKLLDWEYADFQGLPLTDLYNLLVWAYRDIGGNDEPIVGLIKEAFSLTNYLSYIIKDSIKRYCESLSISKELAFAIFLQWIYAEFKDGELIENLASKPPECFNI